MEKECRCRDCGVILNRNNYSPPRESHETLTCHECRKMRKSIARQVIEQHIKQNGGTYVRTDAG